MADEEGQKDELLALEAIYGDKRIFSRVPKEKGGQLNIFLELPDIFMIKVRSSQAPPSRKPHKANTENKRDFLEFPVKYLPPIVLNFEYPEDYPSCSPPSFTISCKWLTRIQLSKLCKYLDDLWMEQGPGEIIFSWDSGIKKNALNILKLQSPYELCFTRRVNKKVDKRAVQDVASYASMVRSVFDFDESEMARVFQTNYFSCAVCFNEKLGSTCMKFNECSHIFCSDCLSEYFTVQINDGAVKNLTCPTPDCETQASPAQVKVLVSPDLFAKYDRFLLQTTLDTMNDVVYCPRIACQTIVLLDKEATVGVCPGCMYAFCIFCKKASHGISPCSISDSEARELRDQWMTSNELERSIMEKKYGKKRLQHVLEEAISDEWLKNNAKKCPRCGCSIQKIEGCNKMTCTKCRCHFCWLCNEVLSHTNPYLHFQDPGQGCFNKLFEGVEGIFDEDEDDWIFEDL